MTGRVDPISAPGQAGAERGASVIVLRPAAVLMVERGRPPFDGVWSFPGGRSLAGEEAEEAARRELLEETSLSVGPLLHLGAFSPAPDRSPLRLDVFCARAGEGEPAAGDDALRAEFVPLATVLQRRRTPGSIGWISRAILTLAGWGWLM